MGAQKVVTVAVATSTISQVGVTEEYRKSGPWEVVSVTEALGGGYNGQHHGSLSLYGGPHRLFLVGRAASRHDLGTATADLVVDTRSRSA